MTDMQSFMHDLMLKALLAEGFAALIWFGVMAGLIYLVWKLFGQNTPTHTIIIRREPSTSESGQTTNRQEPTL